MNPKNINVYPDFLAKSTQWVALTSVFILTPFCIVNFAHDRPLLGVGTLAAIIACTLNVWFGHRAKYCLTLNLFIVVPVILFAIIMAIFGLGSVGTYWAFPGGFAIFFILPKKYAWKANLVFNIAILTAGYIVLNEYAFIRFAGTLIATSLYTLTAINEIYRQHYILKEQVIVDPLTGLYNRFLLNETLDHAVQQYARSDCKVSLLMLDFDHFKSINDDFGHDTGDMVLKAVGKVFLQNFRASDMPFRIGGEEFLVVLYNTNLYGCLKVARKLQIEMEHLKILPNRSITASIGICELVPDMDFEAWVKKCDKNLYRAKHKGRNCIVS